jgi:hypothetical protein
MLSQHYHVFYLRWLDIVIIKILLKNRELKTGWQFLRAGRGNWLTKWKNFQNDLTWDVSSCSRHITPLRVFYSVLCQLLTSLEFSILEKQCAISLYFVWWPICSNFACSIAPLKTFIIQKIKNSVMPKKFYRRIWHFRIFQKNGITEFFYILLIVSFSSK